MAANRRTPEYSSKAGMWSTISAAVQAGWGPTGRLLTVFTLLGVLLIGVTVAAGDNDMLVMLRVLLAGNH